MRATQFCYLSTTCRNIPAVWAPFWITLATMVKARFKLEQVKLYIYIYIAQISPETWHFSHYILKCMGWSKNGRSTPHLMTNGETENQPLDFAPLLRAFPGTKCCQTRKNPCGTQKSNVQKLSAAAYFFFFCGHTLFLPNVRSVRHVRSSTASRWSETSKFPAWAG